MRYLLGFVGFFVGVLIIAAVLVFNLPKSETRFEIAFSAQHARYLGLDSGKVYQDILHELKPTHLRLQANWNDIEPKTGEFNFSELDWLISEAGKAGATVTLAVGRKLPRWPECHDPLWLKNLKPWEVEEYQLKMLQRVVDYYKNNKIVTRWQLENEPLFIFGNCPPPNMHLLKRERDLLKSLDQSRPILITDSGELSPWLETAALADEQGSTLYRLTWDPLVGYFIYPWPPLFYRLKAALVSPFVKKTIISELQMEPWGQAGLKNLNLEDARQSFDLDRFWKNVSFVRKTGFSEALVWGVEWWYASKKMGDDSYWQAGKTLFNDSTKQ